MISEAVVRLELQKEELKDAAEDVDRAMPNEEDNIDDDDLPRGQRRRRRKGLRTETLTQAGFLVLGLQLEDIQ